MASPSSAPPVVSSRAKTYRDYLGFLTPAAATRILCLLGASLLGCEVAARVSDPPYERTAVSSMHGIRAIVQQALDYDAPKIIAVGDSTLIGGGIHDHAATVPGQLFQHIRAPRVFNLAVPGGDNTTSVLLLSALRHQQVHKVDRVIIEVLASKFLTRKPRESAQKEQMQPIWTELQHFIPNLDFTGESLNMPPQSFSDRVEVATQWQMGRISRFYRHRDYFRTEQIGNYPSIWLLGKITPRPILSRLSGKIKGTNRLGARTQDFDFDPREAAPSTGGPVVFKPGYQGEYLSRAIAIAKSISGKPPILWGFPMHFEFEKLSVSERKEFQTATREFEDYLRTVARKEGCEVGIASSSPFQDPRYWTVTAAHFNNTGAAAIAQELRPSLCRLYDCTPRSAR